MRLIAIGLITLVIWGASSSPFVLAEDSVLQVAVTSSFLKPMEKLAPDFEFQEKTTLRLSSGATGKLYAQMQAGAPFHVFLSADSKTPQKLSESGLAWSESQIDYALGQLVLWIPSLPSGADPISYLRTGAFRHLALAQPQTAPYGRAAQECLEVWGLTAKLESKKVFGENVAQAEQFVATGNAEAGFIAHSQVALAPAAHSGLVYRVPEKCHAPLNQSAVILKTAKGRERALAEKLLKYLRSPKVQERLQTMGFGSLRGSHGAG